MRFAMSIVERATCERNQVGAVVASEDGRHIHGYGYNGNEAGGTNGCDRPNEVGSCGCVHAEANALLSAERTRGAVLYTTTAPCEACAKLIVNAGIVRVLYAADYRNEYGLWVLNRARIEHRRYPNPFPRPSHL